MSDELHRLTGVEQQVLSRKSKQTIKKLIESLLEDNQIHWSSTIENIFFAYRVIKHSTTKYSPFKLLYNREQVVPTDGKYKLSPKKNSELMSSLLRTILTRHHTFPEHVATMSKYSIFNFIYYLIISNQKFTESVCWL